MPRQYLPQPYGIVCDERPGSPERASLAVQKENYAVKLYENVGFSVFEEKDQEYIMVCEL